MDGATRDPDDAELELEEMGLGACHSMMQVLCLSSGPPSNLERDLLTLENYIAFYLHQDLEKVQEWTWSELTTRFDDVVDMVRASKGLPPRDQWNPDQQWM